MKINKVKFLVCAVLLLAGLGITGCTEKQSVSSQLMETKVLEESALLIDDEASPKCELKFNYSYLAERDANDTIVKRINRSAQLISFGREYAMLQPEVALDSFKNTYIRNYRRDVTPYYKEELNRNENLEEIPAWYNYSYELTTTFADGYKDVLLFTALNYVYQGGAHPNQWENWRNFDSKTGRMIKLADVFKADSQKEVLELIQNELVKYLAERTENQNLKSFKDLIDEGIILEPRIFIPANFLLEADHITFLYNRYDIAPYAVGDIKIAIPYSAIKKYMQLENIQ